MAQIITAPVKELFESDNLLFDFSGAWEIQYNESLGRNVYASPTIGDNQSASAILSFNCESKCNIRIKYKVSSEANYDKFYFYLDGTAKVNGISGLCNWIEGLFEVESGEHTLEFKYSKDSSQSKNEDKAYVAELEIFPFPYSVAFGSDTIRSIASLLGVKTDFDTERCFDEGAFTANLSFDTKRFFDDAPIEINLYADTQMTFSSAPYAIISLCDTNRSIDRLNILSLDYDIHRDLILNTTAKIDTKRTKTQGILSVMVNYDILRIIAKDSAIIAIKEYEVNLNEKQFAYTFEIQSYTKIALGQNYTINILDLELNANIEKVQIYKGLYSVQASNAQNEAVNNVYNFADKTGTAPGRGTIPTLQAAGQTIGKNSVIRMKEYNTPFLNNEEYTYLELLSELIGWTDRLPQRQVNAYMLGNTVYIIQRGYEQFTAEIPETKYEEPSITLTRKKLLGQGETTLLGETDSGGSYTGGDKDGDGYSYNEGDYLNGTWSYGDTSVTYTNGLVTKERHSTEQGTETTSYYYNRSVPPAKLIYKITSNSEEIKETSYSYSGDYLVTEKEITRDNETGDESIRTTHHYPLGSGFWATVVEEDGKTVSTSIGQGASYEEASAYSVNQYSRKPFTIRIDSPLNPDQGGRPSIKIPNRLLDMDETFPVGTQTALEKIKNDIYWLHGKTEEEVTLTCYIDKAITHNHKILWRGNWYYLKSNQITRNSRRLSQNITMVRWY